MAERHPVIYEINTRVWLGDLSRKYRRVVAQPRRDRDLHANQGLLEDFRRALADFAADDKQWAGVDSNH